MNYFKPLDHHATLLPCAECARLKLGARMAKTEKERQQWQKLLDKHLKQPALMPEKETR